MKNMERKKLPVSQFFSSYKYELKIKSLESAFRDKYFLPIFFV